MIYKQEMLPSALDCYSLLCHYLSTLYLKTIHQDGKHKHLLSIGRGLERSDWSTHRSSILENSTYAFVTTTGIKEAGCFPPSAQGRYVGQRDSQRQAM